MNVVLSGRIFPLSMLIVSSLLGVSLLSMATSAPSYGGARQRAQNVSNIGRFLERYVGDCESDEPDFDRGTCEQEAKSERTGFNGKLLILNFDSLDGQLKLVGWDKRKQAYRVDLTPFFSERALGLSVGKPKRLTKEGFPVVRNIPIWVKRQKDEPEFVFRRQLERGMVRLELLVKPRRAWRLSKGDVAVRGADVALVGLRLYPYRGDDVLAEQTY